MYDLFLTHYSVHNRKLFTSIKKKYIYVFTLYNKYGIYGDRQRPMSLRRRRGSTLFRSVPIRAFDPKTRPDSILVLVYAVPGPAQRLFCRDLQIFEVRYSGGHPLPHPHPAPGLWARKPCSSFTVSHSHSRG